MTSLARVPIVIPLPPITPLNPPLGLLPPFPTRLQPVSHDLSKRPLVQGIMIGLAKAAEWAEAVTGKGELNVLRYGQILKARQLVGVRGAGTGLRRAVLCQKRDPQDQAWRVQAKL